MLGLCLSRPRSTDKSPFSRLFLSRVKGWEQHERKRQPSWVGMRGKKWENEGKDESRKDNPSPDRREKSPLFTLSYEQEYPLSVSMTYEHGVVYPRMASINVGGGGELRDLKNFLRPSPSSHHKQYLKWYEGEVAFVEKAGPFRRKWIDIISVSACRSSEPRTSSSVSLSLSLERLSECKFTQYDTRICMWSVRPQTMPGKQQVSKQIAPKGESARKNEDEKLLPSLSELH